MHKLFYAFAMGGLVFLWISDYTEDRTPWHFMWLAIAIIFVGHFVKWAGEFRAKKSKTHTVDE